MGIGPLRQRGLASPAPRLPCSVYYVSCRLRSRQVRRAPQQCAAQLRRVTTTGSMHILGISGSIRQGSYNTKLLRAAQKVLPEGVTMELADISDLPLINTDLEEDLEAGVTRFPAPVERFRRQVHEADAVLIGHPEYNFTISAPMKNALDWASRPKPHNEWSGKPAAAMSVAGTYGGINGLQALAASNGYLDMQLLRNPRMTLYLRDGPFFDEETGDILDPKVEARLRSVVQALVNWTKVLQQAPA